MKLRHQNANIVSQAPRLGDVANPPVKRAASKQAPGQTPADNIGEPKAKRAVLSELTTKLSSGLVIDSVRKGLGIRRQPTTIANATDVIVGRKTRSQSSKENSSDHKFAPLDQVEVREEESDAVIDVDPCPGYDFDAENKANVFEVPDFAFDIFLYHRAREMAYKIDDYMPRHPRLTKDCRAVLVDWMIELQETFEMNHETLYLSVKLVDSFLQRTKKKVQPSQLQLIASAAVFVAAKYEERSPPLIDDFIYMSEDSITRKALEQMERELFTTVGFDLGAPLSYSHVRRYAKACKMDMPTLTLARYILETSLMCYEFVQASDSKMAAGAFLLALQMKDASAEWTPVMHKYSGYSGAEVAPWAAALNHMLHIRAAGGKGKGTFADQKTVFDKYSHEIFFHSAQVPLIKDEFKLGEPIQCPK